LKKPESTPRYSHHSTLFAMITDPGNMKLLLHVQKKD